MKEQIKELRVKIDGLYQLTKELKPISTKGIDDGFFQYPSQNINSKQIEDATHSLIYAKAWLGKCLGELGEENPYKSGYKTVADIEPTADKAVILEIDAEFWKNCSKDYTQLNHIEKVDWLRTEIEKLTKELKVRKGRTLAGINEEWFNYDIWDAINNSYKDLCEARFALGFELERIKEENK
jgi:hypothetical protein